MTISTLKRKLKKHSTVALMGAYLALTSVYNLIGVGDSVLWDCFYFTIEYGVLCTLLLVGIKDVRTIERIVRIGILSYKIVLILSIYVSAILSKLDYDTFRQSMVSNLMCLMLSIIISIIFFIILRTKQHDPNRRVFKMAI